MFARGVYICQSSFWIPGITFESNCQGQNASILVVWLVTQITCFEVGGSYLAYR